MVYCQQADRQADAYALRQMYGRVKGSVRMSFGCEYCSNYVYDEEEETYVCDVSMDEDDFARMMGERGSRGRSGCPYFSKDDEYAIVRKQI